MFDLTVTIICLPKATPNDEITDVASALLASQDITDTGPIGYFRTATRLRTGQLLQPRNGIAAGGPIRLLDLARMRKDLSQQYWYRWQLWHQIVAGSPVARPWWHFYDRHTANTASYTYEHARHGFASQPRIARMLTYNSHPGRVADLPLQHLDAFEAGPQAYATYGWLLAVPSPSMLTLDGRLLRSASIRHPDQLDYLRRANEHIAGLDAADLLTAFVTT